MIGVVTSLDDKEGLGRVQVRYPHLGDKLSEWARIATPMGGKERGLFLVPEPGEEVVVAHEMCDSSRPFILGAVWSTVDKPPANDGKTVDNNWRFLRSRSGHLLKFDDTSGRERIEIVGKGGKQQIVVDVSGSKIEITCSSGDIAISAPSGKVSLDANSVEIKAKTTMSIEAGAAMTIKGKTVSLNP
jgi:uncharacterized protein involved in type VI secretion and phage assembly